MRLSYWCLLIILPILCSFFIVLIIPPHFIKQYNLDNGRIILDKNFLETIEYPLIIHIIFSIFNPEIMKRWVPLTIDSICEKAINRLDGNDFEFFLDINETMTGNKKTGNKNPQDCLNSYNE